MEAMRKKYDRKHLLLSGQIVRVDFDKFGSAALTLKTANQAPRVFARFRSLDKDQTKDLKAGEHITVLGEYMTNSPKEEVGLYLCDVFELGAPSDSGEPSSKFLVTSIGDFGKEYAQDKAKAEKKYLGKYVRFDADIDSITGTIHLSTGHIHPSGKQVTVALRLPNEDTITGYKPGEKIRVEGRVGPWDVVGPVLEECRILGRVEKEKEIVITAVELTRQWEENEAMARKKFEGKPVIVTGTVAKVDVVNDLGKIRVELYMAGHKETSKLIFTIFEDEKAAAAIRVGQTISIAGVHQGGGSRFGGYAGVGRCKLLKDVK